MRVKVGLKIPNRLGKMSRKPLRGFFWTHSVYTAGARYFSRLRPADDQFCKVRGKRRT